MRVRTIRTHTYNGRVKDGSAHTVEEVADATARNQIAMGYVEAADQPEEDTSGETEAPKRKGKRG